MADKEKQSDGSRKVIYAAIVSNLGIAIAKFTVGVLSGSAAMLAEGIHSTVDTGNEFLLLVGEKMSNRPPSPRHPFGYGKALYFWALIVALSIFTLGGGLSIYHGVHAILHPEPMEDPTWNYVVLGIAACFEGYSWNVSRKELNELKKPGDNMWEVVEASKDATAFTVFIEDSAALLGLAIAAAGIALGQWFDNPYFDPAASVGVGLLLVGAAVVLARETGALLVGEGLGREETGEIRNIFCAEPSITTVGRLRTMQLGPDEVLLNAAVRFDRGMQIGEVEQAIDRLEAKVRKANPSIQHIYFKSAGLRGEPEVSPAKPPC